VFGLYFIKHGKIKVTSSDQGGNERIVRLATDGQVVGHRSYGVESYTIGATALDDSVICFIDNDTLYNAFMKNPTFTYKLMLFYSQELRSVEQRMKYFSLMPVHERVIYALLYVKDVFGCDQNGILNVSISRWEISQLANTSEEQVSRSLTRLEKEKIIAKIVRKIKILDKEKLQGLIEKYL
jgi:CRP/FNR family transcriptional regulator